MKFAKTVLLATAISIQSVSVSAALMFTLAPPGLDNAATTSQKLVETFDELPTGNIKNSFTNAFGTYTVTKGKAKVNNANKWGGAGGDGKYLFIPRGGNEVNLVFNRPVGYFGFWWSAGDGGNKLSVTTKSQTIEFTTQDILNSPVLSAAHYGNPFWGNPSSPSQFHANWEPFAFVNLFVDTMNDAITSIRFHGSNFESDNHTVVTQLMQVSGAAIARFGTTPVPEPASLALVAGALCFLPMSRKLRKRQA